MIERFAHTLTGYYSNRVSFSDVQAEEVQYGFQLLLSTLINVALITIMSIVFKLFIESLFFTTSFISLRVTVGGYHAKSHRNCILINCVVYIAFVLINRMIPPAYLYLCSFACVIISSVIVWFYSPVEIKKKPIRAKQKERLRIQSLIIISALMAITLISYFAPIIPSKLVALGMSGALAATSSAFIEQKKHERSD